MLAQLFIHTGVFAHGQPGLWAMGQQRRLGYAQQGHLAGQQFGIPEQNVVCVGL